LKKPGPTPTNNPLVIAHRGASLIAPENTLAAFALAMESGADGIELDVRLSRDGVPVVIHEELTDAAVTQLDAALAAHRKTAVVIAHGGEGPPARVDAMLARNPNLFLDLSGMHFQRKPALASETGPLDPAWKAVIETHPDRFLIGIDVWAPKLFEPATLDKLMVWTRRILGELKPDVAERVASKNAAALFKLE